MFKKIFLKIRNASVLEKTFSTSKKIYFAGGVLATLLVIALVILVLNRTFAANKANKASTNLPTASSTGCSLPKTEVKEHAFTVGVPAGWIYELNNGTVSIMKDKKNTEGVFLYTAKLIKKDITAKEFLTTSSKFFEKTVAEAGGSFTVNSVTESGDNARGTIEATLDNVPISGLYKVEKTGDIITLKAYYSPKSDMDKSRDNLEMVTSCFSRQTTLTTEILSAAEKARTAENTKVTPSGFSTYTGKYFSLSLPTGYNVTAESDSGIDISRNDNSAGFSYAYVTGAKGPYTSEAWTQYALPKYAGIQKLSLGAGKAVASSVPGMSVQEFSFTGALAGVTSVKGKVTTGVINTTDYGMGSSTSAFWAIQVAAPSVWDSVSANLQKTQDSINIIDIGNTRKSTMLPPNRPMSSSSSSSVTSSSSGTSVSDEVSDNWADAMRGYETVENPTTGQKYDVPLSSWNPTGPSGAGYYLNLPNGGTELLK